MLPDSLASAVRHLASPWHGVWSESVESTQDVARTAASAGAASQSIFVADHQRAGRGRHGRTWSAAPGTALLLSIVFRETTAAWQPWRFTSLAALGLVEALDPLLARGTPAIKWPNDVMLDDRKVAGVLAETSWNGHDLLAIVGVGLNVTAAPELPNVTALADYAQGPLDRGEVLRAFLRRIEHWLHQPPEHLHANWQAHLWGRGQRLRLSDLGETADVVVLGVRDDGALNVELPDGTSRITTTGELLA